MSQDKRLTGQTFSKQTTYQTELLKTNDLPDRASQDKWLTGQSFLCKKLDINIFIGVQLSQAGLNGPLYRAARLTDYQINRSLSRQGLMEACIELQDQQIIRLTGAYPDRAYWKLVSCYKINRVSGDYPGKAYGSLYWAARLTDYRINRSLSRPGGIDGGIAPSDGQTIRLYANPERDSWRAER